MLPFRITAFQLTTGAKENTRKLEKICKILEGCERNTSAGVLRYKIGRQKPRAFLFKAVMIDGQVFVQSHGERGPAYQLQQQGRKLIAVPREKVVTVASGG